MNALRASRGDSGFNLVIYASMAIITVFMLIPILHIVSSSFSNPEMVASGKVYLWPGELTFRSYTAVLENRFVWTGFGNTLLYTSLGTAINLTMTTLAAYPLSRTDLRGGRWILLLLIFTMYFQGGMIPTYILVKKLGFINTIWAMVLPGAISTFNLIVMRTYFVQSIPKELQEAAFIDGSGNTLFLLRIVLPLSKPILAVIALYYAVYHWNDFFQALIYLSDKNRYPLQMVLRELLIQLKIDDFTTLDSGFTERMFEAEGIKYAMIVISSLPMMILYPFIQKSFVKGALIGSIKG